MLNPYEGTEDSTPVKRRSSTVCCSWEGEGEPTEITRLKRDLGTIGDDSIETGTWLAKAMEMTWDAATALVGYPALADLLGDRHRIIANDWQAANMSSLAGRLLQRGVDLLDAVDFQPSAVRADLDGPRSYSALMYSAIELIDRAADLLSDSAGLVHDNEPRWRHFRHKLLPLLDPGE
ncbi:MAG: hypothetical protein R2726_13545 [Acidimicrobiales bacterium]